MKKSLVLAACLSLAWFLAGCKPKTAPVAKDSGRDFIGEARVLYEALLAVSNQVPPGVHPTDFAKHRAFMETKRARFNADFTAKLEPFLGPLRPAGLSKTVVYPFGGSDLAVAIATFPEADEITTISLESAGDPRRIPTNGAAQVQAFETVRKFLGTYYIAHDNSHENVWGMENGILPAQLTFSLGEAALFGMRPVSLRYFRIESNGALHYYEDAEIAALEHTKGTKIHGGWFNPKCSLAFLHMEVRYVRSNGAPFMHRHISANLANDHFKGSPLEAHLKAKGKIAVMTKAASYLPWKPDFYGIRDWMLSAATFMVADSTGVLPWDAEKAGFEVTLYGAFKGAFIDKTEAFSVADNKRLVEYWKSKPYRPMPVRYGYSEIYGSNHFIVYLPKR